MTDPSLFDQTAAAFAATTDEQLAQNRYLRGQHFVAAVLETTSRGAYILDYGCGPGRVARCIAQHGRRVLGVDNSEGMIGQARRLPLDGLPVQFDRCNDDGDDLPLATFDAVVCSSVIEYVKDYHPLLENFSRCLKSRGTLILSYANRFSLWRWYSKWKSAARRPHYGLQHNIWSHSECRRELLRSGFAVFGKPTYFDSPLDRYPLLVLAGKLPCVGTLGLIKARRVSNES